MARSKKQFVEFCIDSQVLRFGEFTLKSGRVSPYFFNAGLFNRGDLLMRLARHYADLIAECVKGDDFVLFGPAYKGIPLAAATAVQLAEHHGRNIGYAFNRKEQKDHGEGGNIVGAELRGRRVVIIDDVITAGTAINEAIAILTAAGATVESAVIALDREEISDGGVSAVQYVEGEHGIAVYAIVTLRDLIGVLDDGGVDEGVVAGIREYWGKFGVGR